MRTIKRVLLCSCALLAVCLSAHAADLPNKAASVQYVSTCTLQNCSGWTFNIGFLGQGSNLNIIGGGIQNSVFAGGGAFGGGFGYQFWNGTWFLEPNINVYYDFSPNSQIAVPGGMVNTTPSSKFLVTEGVKMGTPIGTLLGTASNAPPITIPTSISTALLSPYVQVGAAERSFASGWYVGAGAEFLLASDPRLGAWLLDIDYKAITYNGTISTSPAGLAQVGTENWVGASLVHKF